MKLTQASLPAFSFAAKNYCLLTKPGIIMGNIITMAGGFALAAKGNFPFFLFLVTLLGLGLIIASACVCNNYIDRHADKKMERTKNRPLVLGLISGKKALLFAGLLGVSGSLCLVLWTNLLTLGAALFGFLVYVLLYSFSKYRTMHGTLIGSVAGAVPPVVGYCAVSQQLDAGALILFLMIALWQMPHFFAIALFRLEEYTQASIPVLPIQKGMKATKIHMMLYIIAFSSISSLLTIFQYTNQIFLILTILLGSIWLGLCVQGFKAKDEKKWARKMFFFSLIVVMALSFTLFVSAR